MSVRNKFKTEHRKGLLCVSRPSLVGAFVVVVVVAVINQKISKTTDLPTISFANLNGNGNGKTANAFDK